MLASFFTLFSVAAASELALYWGQNSAGNEQSLGDYCSSSPGDIYLISFINNFGSGQQITMNIHGYYNYIQGTQLLEVSELGKQIQQCQSLGKKVLFSLGGSVGNYGFSSDQDAEDVATQLWNYFGGGYSDIRPFGPDVKLDGFDLDVENKADAAEYVPFVNKLRQLYGSDSSKQYLVTASPQCPFPDATSGDAIAKTDLDYLFIQTYNNYCALSGSDFNFNTWQQFASTQSPNRNVKLVVGLAGSPSAAGSGYSTIDQVKAAYPQLESSPNFGGFSVWDASQANSNIVDGKSYAQQLESILHPPVVSSFSSSSSSATISPTSVASVGSTTTTSGAPAATTTTSPVAIESTSPSALAQSTAPGGIVIKPSGNSTWNYEWQAKWTTVVGTYTTTLPCTTTSTPANGGKPVELATVTTVVKTYTTTVPCSTEPGSAATPAGPAQPAGPGQSVIPYEALTSASDSKPNGATQVSPNDKAPVDTTNYIASTINVVITTTRTIYAKSTVTVIPTPAPNVPVTTINGEVYVLETKTNTKTVNICSC